LKLAVRLYFIISSGESNEYNKGQVRCQRQTSESQIHKHGTGTGAKRKQGKMRGRQFELRAGYGHVLYKRQEGTQKLENDEYEWKNERHC
jgi:hypothetical protein